MHEQGVHAELLALNISPYMGLWITRHLLKEKIKKLGLGLGRVIVIISIKNIKIYNSTLHASDTHRSGIHPAPIRTRS